MYGNSTPACDAHKAGPQVTKFCGVGGVFYLYMLSQKDQDQGAWKPPGEQDGATDESIASYPGQIMPYGLDKFETDSNVNLTQSVSCVNERQIAKSVLINRIRLRLRRPPEHGMLPNKSTSPPAKVSR